MSSSASEQYRKTLYDVAAEEGVFRILDSEFVAFRNELHYRLEKPYMIFKIIVQRRS